jgi:hypothetical protein
MGAFNNPSTDKGLTVGVPVNAVVDVGGNCVKDGMGVLVIVDVWVVIGVSVNFLVLTAVIVAVGVGGLTQAPNNNIPKTIIITILLKFNSIMLFSSC